MATVMIRGVVRTVGGGRPGAARPSRRPITLAHLITAIQDVVGPEDDALVVAIVRHLLRSGRVTWSGTKGVRYPSTVTCWLLSYHRHPGGRGIAGSHRECRRSITGKEVKAVEGSC
jgi:hypothetical protein